MLAIKAAGWPLTMICLPTRRQKSMLVKLTGPSIDRNMPRLLMLGPVVWKIQSGWFVFVSHAFPFELESLFAEMKVYPTSSSEK